MEDSDSRQAARDELRTMYEANWPCSCVQWFDLLERLGRKDLADALREVCEEVSR